MGKLKQTKVSAKRQKNKRKLIQSKPKTPDTRVWNAEKRNTINAETNEEA